MAQEVMLNSTPSTVPEYELFEGGFAADTEVITTDGPVPVANLAAGDRVYALNPTTKLVKLKPVTAVNRVPHDGELVSLVTRRADFRVLPDHRIPFETKSISVPRFQRAGELEQRKHYRFINDWERPNRHRLSTVNITEFLDDYEVCAVAECHGHTFRSRLPEGCEPCRHNGHIGYYFDPQTFKEHQSAIETAADEITVHAGPKHRRRPYRFDGDDFIELLGWFITEGSVYWKADRATAEVQIAQENDVQRDAINCLFDRMDIDVHCNERKIRFGSQLFGRLLERLCGTDSRDKRLPDFIWDLPQEQQQLLLDTLLQGDGNDRQTYYTASQELADGVLRLCVELGMKPRYTRRNGIWQIYVRQVNDGFQSENHVFQVETNKDIFQLTVADYCAVMAGRNGKFQWADVSCVS